MGIIKKLKEQLKNNRQVLENFSYLSAIQVFNIILPFLTYPYLVGVLGLETYGKVVLAQVVAMYIAVFIDFGFTISATKNISFHRDNTSKLSEIVSAVLQVKIISWLLSLLVLGGILVLLPMSINDKLLYLFSFSICFNELLFPVWYFQGMERMKYITIINLISRSCFLVLIFLIVKAESDYLLVPLLNGFGAFLSGIIGLYIVFFKEKIRYQWQGMNVLKYYIKDTFPILLSYIVIAVKDRLNIVFLALGMGLVEVAIYDLATKIMTLVIQPINLINTAIYPKVSKEKNMAYMLNLTKLVFFIIVVGVLVLQLFLPYVINLIDENIQGAVLPSRVLLIAPIIMVWSVALGRNCLLANGLYREFTTGMLVTTIFYLLLISLAYFMGYFNYIMTFVIITILTYFFELIYRWYIARQHKFI